MGEGDGYPLEGDYHLCEHKLSTCLSWPCWRESHRRKETPLVHIFEYRLLMEEELEKLPWMKGPSLQKVRDARDKVRRDSRDQGRQGYP